MILLVDTMPDSAGHRTNNRNLSERCYAAPIALTTIAHLNFFRLRQSEHIVFLIWQALE